MQFYLAVLADTVKTENENPSIGINIFKDKNRTVVECALKSADSPIGVANYMVSEEFPNHLLPTSAEIAESLGRFME
jgi:hypothetical protein